jgi:hypothetical protein
VLGAAVSPVDGSLLGDCVSGRGDIIPRAISAQNQRNRLIIAAVKRQGVLAVLH